MACFEDNLEMAERVLERIIDADIDATSVSLGAIGLLLVNVLDELSAIRYELSQKE